MGSNYWFFFPPSEQTVLKGIQASIKICTADLTLGVPLMVEANLYRIPQVGMDAARTMEDYSAIIDNIPNSGSS